MPRRTWSRPRPRTPAEWRAYRRWKSCERKYKFWPESVAKKKAAAAPVPCRVYLCRHCGCYHLARDRARGAR